MEKPAENDVVPAGIQENPQHPAWRLWATTCTFSISPVRPVG
jgi:hypothetical protein